MTISFDFERFFAETTIFKAREIESGDNMNCYDPMMIELVDLLFMNKIGDYYFEKIVIEWEPVLRTTIKDREELAKICTSNYFISSQDVCQGLSDKNLNDIIHICTYLFNNNEIVEYKQTEVYNTAINMYFSINPHIDIDINFESVISISVLLYFLVRSCRAFPLNKRRRHTKRYYS